MTGKTYVYVGTYTQPILFGTGNILAGKGKGIYCYELESETGDLQLVSENTGIANPSYLTLDNNRRFLYAVNELKMYAGKASGAVSAFALDPDTRQLTFLNQRATEGTDPCHVVVNAGNDHVYVANYMSGSVCVLPIEADGTLGEASQVIQHEGSSVNSDRQSGPHAHSTIFDATHQYALVADLGLDKLMTYKTDANRGTLTPNDRPFHQTDPGSGPRNGVFSADGRFFYLVNELTSSLSVLAFNAQTGRFAWLQTVPTVLDPDFTAENTCADVHLLPNGKFLYASNRGQNTIVIYRIDPDTGLLAFCGTEPCGGEIPRSFAIDPSGKILLAANQNTDNLVAFKIDPDNGTLTRLSETAVPTPVCVRIYSD